MIMLSNSLLKIYFCIHRLVLLTFLGSESSFAMINGYFNGLEVVKVLIITDYESIVIDEYSIPVQNISPTIMIWTKDREERCKVQNTTFADMNSQHLYFSTAHIHKIKSVKIPT